MLLPLPVGPTMAKVEPAGMRRFMSCRTGVPAGLPFSFALLFSFSGATSATSRIGEIEMSKLDFASQ